MSSSIRCGAGTESPSEDAAWTEIGLVVEIPRGGGGGGVAVELKEIESEADEEFLEESPSLGAFKGSSEGSDPPFPILEAKRVRRDLINSFFLC